MASRRRAGRKGFTLLEVMIALAILAVTAAGLITAVNNSIDRSRILELKTFAAWVAQNRLTEIRTRQNWPATGTESRAVWMAGRKWNVTSATLSASRSDMRKIDVVVTPWGEPSLTTTLTGFLGKN